VKNNNRLTIDRSTVEEKSIFGRRLIVAAWIFQITVTFILSFVAYTVMTDSISMYGNDITSEQSTDIFLGSLPFLIISLIELIKIYWVKLLFVSKRLVIKAIVSIILLVSVFITFETVVSVFERQFSSVVSVIQEPINKLQQVNKHIIMIEKGGSLTTGQSLSELKSEKESLKSEIDKYEGLSQIYRFTRYRMGMDSITDITLKDVTKTAFWWYGTLAMLVSIMGVILAFFGYILQRTNKE
jgi:hypothetical protein